MGVFVNLPVGPPSNKAVMVPGTLRQGSHELSVACHCPFLRILKIILLCCM